MKRIWKVLMGAAAVAAVTPYKVRKDEETGEIKLKAATWAGTYTKGPDGPYVSVKLLPSLRKEDECCCDDECECCADETAEPDESEGITIEVEDDQPAAEAEEPATEAEAEAEPATAEEHEAAPEEPKPEEA